MVRLVVGKEKRFMKDNYVIEQVILISSILVLDVKHQLNLQEILLLSQQ